MKPITLFSHPHPHCVSPDKGIQILPVLGDQLHLLNLVLSCAAVAILEDLAVLELDPDIIFPDFVSDNAGPAADIFIALHALLQNSLSSVSLFPPKIHFFKFEYAEIAVGGSCRLTAQLAAGHHAVLSACFFRTGYKNVKIYVLPTEALSRTPNMVCQMSP